MAAQGTVRYGLWIGTAIDSPASYRPAKHVKSCQAPGPGADGSGCEICQSQCEFLFGGTSGRERCCVLKRQGRRKILLRSWKNILNCDGLVQRFWKIHVERVIIRGCINPKIPAFIKLWYRPNIDRQLKNKI